MRRLATTMMCLSLFVCGTMNAKKKTIEQKKTEVFTQVDFKTIKSPNSNPFGLVYDNAIKENEQGKVNIHRINYLLMTEQCYAKATGTNDKELYLIPGATHIKTYYVPEYVELAVKKLTEFFGNRL